MRVVIILLALLNAGTSFGQESRLNTKSSILIDMGFSYHLAGGDLTKRFGNFSAVQGGISYRLPKGNWQLGLNYSYHFGNTVKEDVLDPLRNERGVISGSDGFPVDIFLRLRSYRGSAILSYHYDLLKDSDSDLTLSLGAGGGFMQHWIRLQDERNTATQLRGPYEAGYDRKTQGFTTNQTLGLQYLQANRRINFYLMFEFVQAFTQSIRPWDYDLRSADKDKRFDSLNGVRIGWILPIYLNQNDEIIYY
jgi:hypothetical protein